VPHPYNPYQRIPESVRITLKTSDEEKTIEAGSSVAQQIVAQGISEGHVIQIDAETGRVVSLGLSLESVKGKTYDVDTDVKVPRPSGPILKEKEFVYTLTLADLDELQARRRSGGLFSLLFGTSPERELDVEIRMAVDQQVKEWVDEGRAIIRPGVLFIDDAHLLDLEAFSFLGRAMESELVPIIILATNRGIARIRGTDIKSPFGFPLDLIDRAVIITTQEYDRDCIKEILKIRAREERFEIEDDALEKLVDIGVESSLRYAVQLLSFAVHNAKRVGHKKVTVDDVETVKNLFMDVKEASEYLRRYEERFLSH